jgi:hypothetical protein
MLPIGLNCISARLYGTTAKVDGSPAIVDILQAVGALAVLCTRYPNYGSLEDLEVPARRGRSHRSFPTNVDPLWRILSSEVATRQKPSRCDAALARYAARFSRSDFVQWTTSAAAN